MKDVAEVELEISRKFGWVSPRSSNSNIHLEIGLFQGSSISMVSVVPPTDSRFSALRIFRPQVQWLTGWAATLSPERRADWKQVVLNAPVEQAEALESPFPQNMPQRVELFCDVNSEEGWSNFFSSQVELFADWAVESSREGFPKSKDSSWLVGRLTSGISRDSIIEVSKRERIFFETVSNEPGVRSLIGSSMDFSTWRFDDVLESAVVDILHFMYWPEMYDNVSSAIEFARLAESELMPASCMRSESFVESMEGWCRTMERRFPVILWTP